MDNNWLYKEITQEESNIFADNHDRIEIKNQLVNKIFNDIRYNKLLKDVEIENHSSKIIRLNFNFYYQDNKSGQYNVINLEGYDDEWFIPIYNIHHDVKRFLCDGISGVEECFRFINNTQLIDNQKL